MKRLIIAACVAVSLLGTPALASSLFDQAVAPVVKIDNDCSATIIKNDRDDKGKYTTQLLTAKHCVVDRKNGTMDYPREDKGLRIGNTVFTYQVKKQSYLYDLALLELRDTTTVFPVAKIADKLAVEEGDLVWAVGYPLAATRTVTLGTFNGFQNTTEGTNDTDGIYIRGSAAMTFGNSGGALFQKDGDTYELIGVTSMKYRENHFMNLFVKLKDIRAFVVPAHEDSAKQETMSVTDPTVDIYTP